MEEAKLKYDLASASWHVMDVFDTTRRQTLLLDTASLLRSY